MVAVEKKITGLCSDSMFSSSLKIGFALIVRSIIFNSHTSQANLDSMACGLIKYKTSVFSVFVGCSVMVNTFISLM